MKTKLSLLLLLSGGIAWAQQPQPVPPDCSINFSFTAAGSTSTSATTGGCTNNGDNRFVGADTWTLVYTSTGFTGLTLTFESAPTGPNAAGTFVTYAGTTVKGSNPLTATDQGIATFTNLGTSPVATPWVRVTLSGLTGSGRVSGVLYGYKTGYTAGNGGGGGGGGGCSGGCTPGAVVTATTPTTVGTPDPAFNYDPVKQQLNVPGNVNGGFYITNGSLPFGFAYDVNEVNAASGGMFIETDAFVGAAQAIEQTGVALYGNAKLFANSAFKERYVFANNTLGAGGNTDYTGQPVYCIDVDFALVGGLPCIASFYSTEDGSHFAGGFPGSGGDLWINVGGGGGSGADPGTANFGVIGILPGLSLGIFKEAPLQSGDDWEIEDSTGATLNFVAPGGIGKPATSVPVCVTPAGKLVMATSLIAGATVCPAA